MAIPKLIILRGPSGSGKTTISKLLLESTTRRTTLIEQDHYRFIFKPPGGGTKPNIDTIHKMIKANTLIALADGYDVILEGILSVKSYEKVLDEIFAEHPEQNYMFYFDISLQETLRRHVQRRNPDDGFNENDMTEWYPAAHKSGHKLENIIPENYSTKKSVQFIQTVSGLKTSSFS